MAIPPQQDYNRCESGPVARERGMGTPFMCIHRSNTLLFFNGNPVYTGLRRSKPNDKCATVATVHIFITDLL